MRAKQTFITDNWLSGNGKSMTLHLQKPPHWGVSGRPVGVRSPWVAIVWAVFTPEKSPVCNRIPFGR